MKKLAISRKRVCVAMYADSVINTATVRKIDGSFSWIHLYLNTGKLLCDLVNEETTLCFFLIAASDRKDFSFYQNDNIRATYETDMSLMRSIIDGLTSRLFLSSRALSGTSIFSYNLFCWEKQDEAERQAKEVFLRDNYHS